MFFFPQFQTLDILIKYTGDGKRSMQDCISFTIIKKKNVPLKMQSPRKNQGQSQYREAEKKKFGKKVLLIIAGQVLVSDLGNFFFL